MRIVFQPRTDRHVQLYSVEYDGWFEFNLDSMTYNQDVLWSNYIQGVAWALQEAGLHLTGMDAVISGNVPKGSGLSSSAALGICHGRLSGV